MSEPTTASMPRKVGAAYVRGMAALCGLTLVGFLMIGLGWRSVARTTFVDLQVPPLVSGCVAGLLVVAVGVGLAVGLHARRAEAVMRAHTEAVLVEARALFESVTRGERLS